MTGTMRVVGAALGEPKKATGLTAALLPVWVLYRVSGKKVMGATSVGLNISCRQGPGSLHLRLEHVDGCSCN